MDRRLRRRAAIGDRRDAGACHRDRRDRPAGGDRRRLSAPSAGHGVVRRSRYRFAAEGASARRAAAPAVRAFRRCTTVLRARRSRPCRRRRSAIEADRRHNGRVILAAAVSWLYYANRLYELPLGVVSIAISAVLVPTIAAGVRSAKSEVIAAAQSRGFEIALGLALPSAVAFALLAVPIAGGLFERGAFGPRDTAAVAAALAAICAG